MKLARIVVSAAVFLGIAGAAGGLYLMRSDLWGDKAAEGGWEPTETVRIGVARLAEWYPTQELVGTLFSIRSVELGSESPGRIAKVNFDTGSIVEAGEVLVELDSSEQRANVEASEAAVRVARAELHVVEERLSLAELELRRMREASESGGAKPIELDRMVSQREAMVAETEQKQAEIVLRESQHAQAKVMLDKMLIRAPFRARVGLRTVHEGQVLAEGDVVARLQELTDRIYLDFAVPQDYVTRVKPGMSVMATSDVLGDKPIRIEVASIDAAVDLATRNLRVRAVLDNQDDALRPGMFIRIRVPVDEPRQFVMIPQTSVRRTSYADQVFVIETDATGARRAKQRFVKLGAIVGEDVIVNEGVNAGELVAVTGAFKLREGVKVIDEAEAAKPPAGGPGAAGGGAAGPPGEGGADAPAGGGGY